MTAEREWGVFKVFWSDSQVVDSKFTVCLGKLLAFEGKKKQCGAPLVE